MPKGKQGLDRIHASKILRELTNCGKLRVRFSLATKELGEETDEDHDVVGQNLSKRACPYIAS